MSSNLIKVGIVGARPVSIGGHDSSDFNRSNINNTIGKFLQELLAQYEIVVGITGLGVGAEQDFAHQCIINRIDYICYLPFADQESYWKFLPESLIKDYNLLLETALETFIVSEGHYSPKKIQLKNQKIIEESDYIIIVENKFNALKCIKSIEYAKALQKKILVVNNTIF